MIDADELRNSLEEQEKSLKQLWDIIEKRKDFIENCKKATCKYERISELVFIQMTLQDLGIADKKRELNRDEAIGSP